MFQQFTAHPAPPQAQSAPVAPPAQPVLGPEPSEVEIFAEISRMEGRYRPAAEPTPDYLQPVQTVRYEQPKPGRDDDCPCGSYLKHKKCCGT